MKKIICLLKKDITLSASGFLALISAFFVVPDKEYLSYINVPVLVLLFSLMVIVSGFEKTGLFDFVKRKLSSATLNASNDEVRPCNTGEEYPLEARIHILLKLSAL